MEKRWNVRMPVETEVQIRYPDRKSIRGKTRDVSFEGMYVETDAKRLAKAGSSLVQLEFTVRDGARDSSFRVPAIIVRRTDSGVGVMYPDYDDAVFDGLALLLARHFTDQQFGSDVETDPDPLAEGYRGQRSH